MLAVASALNRSESSVWRIQADYRVAKTALPVVIEALQLARLDPAKPTILALIEKVSAMKPSTVEEATAAIQEIRDLHRAKQKPAPCREIEHSVG